MLGAKEVGMLPLGRGLYLLKSPGRLCEESRLGAARDCSGAML